jgi:hypothetical protein
LLWYAKPAGDVVISLSDMGGREILVLEDEVSHFFII